MVRYVHLFKNFPVCCDPHSQRLKHSQWSRSFLEFPYFLYYLTNVGNLVTDSSTFSKSRFYIWKFLVHILLKPSWKDFKWHYFARMWNEHNCAVVRAFFGIAFLWDWNENWPFPVLWPLLSFPNLLPYYILTAASFRIWNSSAGIPSPPLALFVVMLPQAHLTSHSGMSGSRWVTTIFIILCFIIILLFSVREAISKSDLPSCAWAARGPCRWRNKRNKCVLSLLSSSVQRSHIPDSPLTKTHARFVLPHRSEYWKVGPTWKPMSRG